MSKTVNSRQLLVSREIRIRSWASAPCTLLRVNYSRGFTLLTAVILSSVILSLGIALLDISYKQSILASSAKSSQYAFYAADSAMECVLYFDQQQLAFDYSTLPLASITCNNQTINITNGVNSIQNSGALTRTTTFDIPCASGGATQQAHVVITKSSTNVTSIFATGYSSCLASDPRRIERGLKANY